MTAPIWATIEHSSQFAVFNTHLSNLHTADSYVMPLFSILLRFILIIDDVPSRRYEKIQKKYFLSDLLYR